MKLATVVIIFIFGNALGYKNKDPILRKADPDGFRYQYTFGPDGLPHLVDTWQTLPDLVKLSRYNPDTDNEYHLFTRLNPTTSQPLLPGNAGLFLASNYNSTRRTIILIHGWGASIYADFNVVMIPAFIASDDVNVIAVDWATGSVLGHDATVASGRSVANFISWIKSITNQPAEDFHVVGFSFGAHHAGITARYVEGGVGYVTGLDPANSWGNNEHIFHRDDGLYTEAIWTNAGVIAHLGILADADFFPNGGTNMTGCAGDGGCNHARAYFYLAESIVTGGFTSVECETLEDARAGTCDLPGRMQMGSRYPSIGSSGIYYLQTNAAPPFSIN